MKTNNKKINKDVTKKNTKKKGKKLIRSFIPGKLKYQKYFETLNDEQKQEALAYEQFLLSLGLNDNEIKKLPKFKIPRNLPKNLENLDKKELLNLAGLGKIKINLDNVDKEKLLKIFKSPQKVKKPAAKKVAAKKPAAKKAVKKVAKKAAPKKAAKKPAAKKK